MSAASKRPETFLEQRLQERFSLHLPVRVSIDTESGTEVQFETFTANVSSGGAFISTTDPLPIACKIYLEFYIAFRDLKKLRFILSLESLRQFEGKPVWVKATGVVIRHETDGMAVIFDDDYQLSPLPISKE